MAEMRSGRPVAASQRPTGGDKAIVSQKKQYFRRKKLCRFCVDKIDDINYKDVKLLSAFVSDRGKITPRRISGVCTPHQRRLADARQFYISLQPVVGNPSFDHEPGYPRVPLPDPGYQVLALYRFWNIIQYWYPNRDVIGEDWAGVLRDALPRVAMIEALLAASNAPSFHDRHP